MVQQLLSWYIMDGVNVAGASANLVNPKSNNFHQQQNSSLRRELLGTKNQKQN